MDNSQKVRLQMAAMQALSFGLWGGPVATAKEPRPDARPWCGGNHPPRCPDCMRKMKAGNGHGEEPCGVRP